MDMEPLVGRIRALFKDLESVTTPGGKQVLRSSQPLLEELSRLEEDVKGLRVERDRLSAIVDEAALLLRSKSQSHLIHDLRNVLNDVVLLKAMLESVEGKSLGE